MNQVKFWVMGQDEPLLVMNVCSIPRRGELIIDNRDAANQKRYAVTDVQYRIEAEKTISEVVVCLEPAKL